MRDSRMRICFAVETYPSVTQTFVYEPVDWLERAGHHVAVVAAVREELPSGDGFRLVSSTLEVAGNLSDLRRGR